MEGAQLLADWNIVEDRKFLGCRREVFGPLCVRTRLIRQSLTGDETPPAASPAQTCQVIAQLIAATSKEPEAPAATPGRHNALPE